ncbi:NRDE family protein [Actinospica robiniae]|uniref:NRDE family protein n=1 Tax=Actinospica robiniae TaxID=304901 RepID=UPI00040A411A|nr:NRDE family protein [Actinospica robiniae]
MCTVVLDFDPGSRVPVLLIGVRDEQLDRPWVGPGPHWPQWPDLVGGQDLLAGGTWLAVDPGAPRAVCVLNGHGRHAPEETRLSRGELPLRYAARAAESELDPELSQVVEVERYDPFHLVCVTPDSARIWSWDGERLTGRVLAPGLHFVVNCGLEGADPGAEGPGAQQMHARIAHFRPLLAAADRPEPLAGTVAEVWGGWLALADGAGLAFEDPRALLVRAEFGGRLAGSSSVSLVALSRDRARYDFRAVREEADGWTTVLDAARPTIR